MQSSKPGKSISIVFLLVFSFLTVAQNLHAQGTPLPPELDHGCDARHVGGGTKAQRDLSAASRPVAPGIDIRGWGVIGESGNDMRVYVNVYDYNGISSDGRSHTVIVQPPSGDPITLAFAGKYSDYRAGYTAYLAGVKPKDGVYTFKVTDDSNLSGTVKEKFKNKPVARADSSSITIAPNGTTPVVSWKAVKGAKWYSVIVHDQDGRSIATLAYTRQKRLPIPPGVLSPNATYGCSIQAIREDPMINIQNRSSSSRVPFTTGETSQAPYIRFDASPWQTGVASARWHGQHLEFRMAVHDAQGVPDNIERVEVLFPDESTREPLFHSGSAGWGGGIYRSRALSREPISGKYTFVVRDKDGNTFKARQSLKYNPMKVPDWQESSPADNAVVKGKNIVFDWPSIEGARAYYLEIYDKSDNFIFDKYLSQSGCTLPKGILREGETYSYWVGAASQHSYGQNRVYMSYENQNKFILSPGKKGSSFPEIRDHYVSAIRADCEDVPEYWLYVSADVEDLDGIQNVQKVMVELPGGESRTLNEIYAATETTAEYTRGLFFDSASKIESGTYTISATDFDGNTSKVTVELNVDPLPRMTNDMTQPAHNSVVRMPVKLSWKRVEGAAKYAVKLFDWKGRFLKRYDDLTKTGFTLPNADVQSGQAYRYRVLAIREDARIWGNISYSQTSTSLCPLFIVKDNQ